LEYCRRRGIELHLELHLINILEAECEGQECSKAKEKNCLLDAKSPFESAYSVDQQDWIHACSGFLGSYRCLPTIAANLGFSVAINLFNYCSKIYLKKKTHLEYNYVVAA
jgi:hypothetical protein